MRFVTCAAADGDRVGVLAHDLIHTPKGTAFLDVLGRLPEVRNCRRKTVYFGWHPDRRRRHGVRLLDLGPAHTASDTVVHVPAAFGIDLGAYRDWLDAERVAVNVHQRYRELDPDQPALDRFALFALMAEWDRKAHS
ncbi:hypothetical protein ACQPW3_12240 [Actinosynnema sp. CA-248983]